MDLKSKIILISGPTASGKSNFAIKLAKKIDGEIINADSMQVYKELKVLSARPFKKDYQKMFKEPADFNKGGIVDAADVQYAAPGGFFSKMFGKPPAYMKEEIAKTDIFSPTTDPIDPPIKEKSIEAIVIFFPLDLP